MFFLSDWCEVGNPDVVGECFEVEFSFLGCSFSAEGTVSVASFQCTVNGFGFAPLMIALP